MSRGASTVDDMPGQDSFLDIVANIVGILIILVLVAGVRARDTWHRIANEKAEPSARALVSRQAEAVSLANDIERLNGQRARVRREVKRAGFQRDQLQTAHRLVEIELAERRSRLDDVARADYDLQQELAARRTKLAELTDEQIALDTIQDESVQITHYQTPISKTVLGKELHFQARDGRIVSIPLEELLQRLQAEARQKAWKLESQQTFTSTVGPIDGFRLRYELERFDIPVEVQRRTGRGGRIVRLVQWQLLPVSNHLGEVAKDALSDGSAFRQALRQINRRAGSITIWTYPDSFGTFREIKSHLHREEFTVAARPLPSGVPIGGSPDGTKSSAQ